MSLAYAVLALAVTLGVALGWRHRAAPGVGALLGVIGLALAGLLDAADLGHAARTLWRPMITISAIMVMTTCAHQLGLLDRLAAVIEPRTRGPVRHAFRVVFVLSSATAAVLSNDGAILVLTPTVMVLLRQVYPRRHPKFVVPFAFAVFYAAGVAPLVTSNPMNLVVADKAGIDFNSYALRMIPVALVGWVTAYAVLTRLFRDALADEAPALGAAPTFAPLARGAGVVLLALATVLCAYPVVSYLDGPLWAVATTGAVVCAGAALAAGIRPGALAAGPSWEILPFLAGVLLIAVGLERAGVVTHLAALYATTPLPIATIGAVAAVGSALIDNHPMAMLGLLALERIGADTVLTLAMLIGGDLGPRLSPIGSLAGLLWLGALRRQGVQISVVEFARVGLLVTIPSLAASLTTLWLLTRW